MSDTDVIPDPGLQQVSPQAMDEWRRSTPLPPQQPGGGAGAPSLAPQSPMAPPSLGGNQAEAAERKDMAGPVGKLAGLQGQKPQTPNLQENNQPPPDAKEYQKHSMEFAGAMAVLGAIAGRFTRAPGGAALGAFASALKGWKEGNQQAYENASKEWEEKTKQTIQNNKTVMDKYKLALEDHTKNIDEQMSAIQVIATQYHDQQMYDAAGSKNFTMVAKLYDKNQAQSGRLEGSFEWLSGQLKTERSQKAVLAEKVISGEITPRSETERLSFKHLVEQYRAGEYGDVGGPKTPKVAGGLKGGLLAEADAERQARGEAPMTAEQKRDFNLAPPRSAPAMALRKFMEKHPEADDQALTQFSATYNEAQSRARTLGTRSGNIDIAVNEASAAAKQALKASEAVPRGEFVPINQLSQRAQKAGSSPALKRFEIANASLITAYSQTMSRTGANTVTAQNRATELLATATGPEAYKAGVEQLLTEMSIVQDAVRDVESGDQAGASGGGGAAAAPASGAGWTDVGGGVRIREKP